jgi:quinoprotein glucose dehydrogenase
VGIPAVYEVNGREYILFSLIGGPGFPPGARMPPGGVNPPPGQKAYVAFALPN